MAEPRNLKLDLLALALLAVVLFLVVAIATYDPQDPIEKLSFPLSLIHHHDPLVFPQRDEVHNACGNWGALAADMLFSWLGLGTYYALFSLAVLDMLLLGRRAIDLVWLRTCGWLLSLAGLCTLLTLAIDAPGAGPAIGPGGYLGALGRLATEKHFATIGGMILATTTIISGLLLSTDYALIKACLFALNYAFFALGKLREQWPRSIAPTKTDLEDPALPAEVPTGELGIKVRGKQVQKPAPAPVVEEEEFEESEEESPATIAMQPVAKAAAASAPAAKKSAEDESSLRVKNPNDRKRDAAATQRDQLLAKLNETNIPGDPEDYQLPSIELLLPSEDIDFDSQATEVRRKAKILEKTFADFGFTVKVVEIETGPVIAQYEVELEAGLRLSKITSLADDLAIALRVPSVRIVAPIPGKNTVGIEVPNEQRQTVRLREVIEESAAKIKKMRIPLFLGKDVSGNPLVADLSALPHLLIAGRTGTGKSVCLNAIISSILMTRRPDEVRMLMIDPKMVELSGYARLPHLMHPVVTDMRKAEAILAWAVEKMEERYALLARAGVRHISSYNQLGEEELMDRLEPENDDERNSIPRQLPFIVIVADEMADLMMTSGKEVEQHIIRLAQKSRAVGIHLILATQKPTVDVITGLIKSNLPARIAFQVASRTDSRVVLDEMGADKLLGNGDMLFLWPGTSTLLRGQGTYLSDEEINQVVDFVSTGEQNFVGELVNMKVATPAGDGKAGPLKERDELYTSAIEVVIREGRGSVSLLQRALGIGYGRAARLIDFMAEDGIVGQYAGSQAREVMLTMDQWEQMQAGEAEAAPPPKPAKSAPAKRSNRITPEPWPEEEAEEASAELDSEEDAEQEDEESSGDGEDYEAATA